MSKSGSDYVRELHPSTGRTYCNDGSVFNVADFARDALTSVWRGYKPGAMPFSSQGEVNITGAVTNYPLWPGGATLPTPLPSGRQLTVVSTSADDAAGGDGAREIIIEYLDNGLHPRQTTVALNGQTPVLTPATDIRWIQVVLVSAVGPTALAVGTITMSYGGTNYAVILPGYLSQTSSFRMVPADYRAFITNVLLSSVSTTADSWGIIRTAVVYNGILIPTGAIGTQNNNFQIQLAIGSRVLLPGMILGLTVTTNKSLIATGEFVGWIEPYV